jgi:hypothetical protein
MKQEKRISKTVEKYGSEWPPEDAAGFMAWFQKRIDDVPPERRATARIKLEYALEYATIEISYTRMETDEEEVEREQQAAGRAWRRRAEELRKLAELQAKYGKPTT